MISGKNVLIILVLFAAVYTCCPLWVFTQESIEEKIFFSYERFYLTIAEEEDPPRDGIVQTNISDFTRHFSDGIYSISAEPEKAIKELLKARKIWPEYFGTDFLLARVNEDMGRYGLSARYYKSYLNKLRSLHAGEYRISGNFIKAITPYKIENYDEAYILVENRLRRYGIDLAGVRPVYTFLPFIKYLIVFLIIGAGYAAFIYKGMPYIRKRQRVKNPPEGFWVCDICGTENTLIRKNCEKCDNPRKGEK